MQENRRENSIIKARILEYLEFKDVSKYECYQKTGMSRSVLSQSNGMTEDNILRFIAVYQDINPNWLLTGQGEMLKSDREEKEIYRVPDGSPEGIPLIPLNAMAGFGTGEAQVLEYECERYIVPMFREAQFLIPVKGSSMIPKYNSGDLVACKKLLLNDIFFQWNKVYVLDTAQGALIKRICRGCDTEHIKLVSENEKYEPFELHLSQINAVALVVGVIRLE